MSLTYGFYNSLNHDRLYDATQVSSIFDGIINDGIFESIGEQMRVSATDQEMKLKVGPGRAWFDHTWTLIDADYLVDVPQSETVLDRIDALVLEVNHEMDTRANSIKIVKGTPSTEPVKPTLTNTTTIHQHVLAYITIHSGVKFIGQQDIENMIGTTEVPFITGILKVLDATTIIAQWKAQFNDQMNKDQINFTTWFNSKKQEYIDLYQLTEAECQQLFDETDAKIAEMQGRVQGNQDMFDSWFANLQNQLDSNQAAHLQNQIDNIVGIGDSKIDALFKEEFE